MRSEDQRPGDGEVSFTMVRALNRLSDRELAWLILDPEAFFRSIGAWDPEPLSPEEANLWEDMARMTIRQRRAKPGEPGSPW